MKEALGTKLQEKQEMMEIEDLVGRFTTTLKKMEETNHLLGGIKKKQLAILQALIVKVSPFLPHISDHVAIGYSARYNDGESTRRTYFPTPGVRVVNRFDRVPDAPGSRTGKYIGDRLYLLETGAFFSVTREGSYADVANGKHAWISTYESLSSEEVLERYHLKPIVTALLRQFTESADRILSEYQTLVQQSSDLLVVERMLGVPDKPVAPQATMEARIERFETALSEIHRREAPKREAIANGTQLPVAPEQPKKPKKEITPEQKEYYNKYSQLRGRMLRAKKNGFVIDETPESQLERGKYVGAVRKCGLEGKPKPDYREWMESKGFRVITAEQAQADFDALVAEHRSAGK